MQVLRRALLGRVEISEKYFLAFGVLACAVCVSPLTGSARPIEHSGRTIVQAKANAGDVGSAGAGGTTKNLKSEHVPQAQGLDESLAIIKTTDALVGSFEGWYPPTRAKQYTAFQTVLANGKAVWPQLIELTKVATPGGRLYAAAALYEIDKPASIHILEGMLTDGGAVETRSGCIVSRYLVKDLIARLLYDGQVIDTKPEALETLKSESVKKLQEGYENPDGVLEALFAHADDWRSGYYAPILPDTLLPGDDARIRSSYGNSAVAGLFLNEIALRNQLAWHLTDAKKLYEEVIAIEDNPKNAVDGITLSREIGEIGPSWVKRETDPKVFDRRTRLCGYLRNYQKLLDCMMRHGEAAAVGKRIDAVDLAAPGR